MSVPTFPSPWVKLFTHGGKASLLHPAKQGAGLQDAVSEGV